MKNKVFQMAWNLVRETAIGFQKALKIAWNVVKAQTYKKFEIEFVKESTGEITKRTASSAKLKNATHLLFWSETNNGFRMAITSNILSIKKFI